MDTKKILSIAIMAIVILLPAWTEAKDDPNTATTFVLKSQDGKNVNLADLKANGNIVVLEWTNPECPFVKAHYTPETMTMKKLAEKYTKDKKVVWLAINSSHFTTPEQNQDFVKQFELPYAVLLDNSGKVGKSYGAKTTPHMYIINTDGKIVYRGAIDNAPLGKKPEDAPYINYVQQALDELLAGKSVSISQTKPYGCSVKYVP